MVSYSESLYTLYAGININMDIESIKNTTGSMSISNQEDNQSSEDAGLTESLENNNLCTLPDKNENYKDVVYWNQRYSNEEFYEWCKDYAIIKDLIQKHVKKNDLILVVGKQDLPASCYIFWLRWIQFETTVENNVKQFLIISGCGNSNFSIDLYNDGFKNITNIDYSPVVIEKHKEKYGHLMKYLVMDMRELHFNEEKFDIVIEKCTLDVLYTAETSPWNISEETQLDLDKTLTGIKNVLKDTATSSSTDVSNNNSNNCSKFISITFGEPYFRRKLYSKYWENIQVETFGDFFHYYFYVNY